MRRIIRPIAAIIIIGFAVHILLPQLGELPQAVAALREGRWRFLGIALVGSVFTFLAEVWMIREAVDTPPPWVQTTIVEVAAFFAATVTPARVGWLGVNQQFLERAGNDMAGARTAITLTFLLTVLSHLALLLGLVPFLPAFDVPTPTLPEPLMIAEVVALFLVVVGVLFWIPPARRRILTELLPVLRAMPHSIENPRRTAVMVVAALCSNLAYAMSLMGSIAAFGETPSFIGVLLAYLIASAAGTVSPTPGGLGATETALVVLLGRLGIVSGAAVAAVLAFRFITFWLPLPLGAWSLHYANRRGWVSV